MIHELPKNLIKTAKAILENDRITIHYAVKLPTAVLVEHGFDKTLLINESYDVFKTDDDHLIGHILKGEEISFDSDHYLHKHHLIYTPEEKSIIREYTSNGQLHGSETGSKMINKFLYNQHIENKTQQPNFVYPDGHTVDLNHLNYQISRNHIREPLVTFSGVSFNPYTKIENNKIFLPAFTSSSLHHEIAVQYAKPINGVKHVIAIHHKQFDPALYVGIPRYRLSNFREHEVIIPKETTLIHNGKTVDGTTSIHGHKVKVWYMFR